MTVLNETFLIYRSTNTAAPANLIFGRLAFTTNGNILYIGNTSSNAMAIGGLRTPGVATANQALVLDSSGKINVINTGTLTMNTVSISAINTVSNSTVLGLASNNELATTWAIKNYVDTAITPGKNAGNGLTSNSTAYAVNPGSGIVANSTGTFVNSAYIATITANNTNFVGAVSAANVVSNAQLIANLANYTTTAATKTAANGLSSNATNFYVVAGNSQVISNSSGTWIDQTQINHDLLSNFVANKHIDHTAVSITAGNGLAGGGDISATRTLSINSSNGIVSNSTGIFLSNGTGVVINSIGISIGQNVNTTSSPTFQDLTVQGNLAINGTLTNINTVNLTVTDSIIKLANGNATTDSLDSGWYGMYGNSTVTSFAGVNRAASDGKFHIFKGVQVEPTTTVNTIAAGYAQGTLVAALESNNATITGGVFSSITTISVGNSTVNTNINSTSFSGTANNALNLGGTLAASFVQNTDSRVLSGNLNFSAANVNFTTGLNTGNSTVNSTANSTLFQVINSTATANLGPASLVIGTSTVGAASITEGANVTLDTVKLAIGNSTVNATANSITLAYNGTATQYTAGFANVGANVSLSTVLLSIGNSTVNSVSNSIGISLNAGAVVVNNSLAQIGSNVTLDTTKLSVGNTTANMVANSILYTLANSTSTANLTPAALVIGTTTVNTVQTTLGSNVFLDTVKLSIGNSTVNSVSNSIGVSLNGGAVVVNNAQVTVGANIFISTSTVSVGNTTANLLANSILVTVANSTGTANLQPTQLVIGSATVNSTAHISGANVFLDTIKLSMGNTTVNSIANSINHSITDAAANAQINSTSFALSNSTVSFVITKPSAAQVTAATAYLNANGSWIVPAGGGGTPGGANTNVQVNDSGVFYGSTGMVFDKTSNNFTIANTLISTLLFSIGNSTINVSSNSTSMSFGAAVTINTTAISAPNTAFNDVSTKMATTAYVRMNDYPYMAREMGAL